MIPIYRYMYNLTACAANESGLTAKVIGARLFDYESSNLAVSIVTAVCSVPPFGLKDGIFGSSRLTMLATPVRHSIRPKPAFLVFLNKITSYWFVWLTENPEYNTYLHIVEIDLAFLSVLIFKKQLSLVPIHNKLAKVWFIWFILILSTCVQHCHIYFLFLFCYNWCMKQMHFFSFRVICFPIACVQYVLINTKSFVLTFLSLSHF